MSRAERHKEAARKVEDTLRAEGRGFEADQIRHVRVSLSTCQGTLSRVHKEYLQALARIKELERQNG